MPVKIYNKGREREKNQAIVLHEIRNRISSFVHKLLRYPASLSHRMTRQRNDRHSTFHVSAVNFSSSRGEIKNFR